MVSQRATGVNNYRIFSPKGLVALFFAILPFIFNPFAPIPFEIPRVEFFLRFVEFFSIFSYLLYRKNFNLIQFKTIIPVLLLLSVSVVSSISGVDPLKSIVGNVYRQDGLLTLVHLIGFSLLINLIWKKDYVRIISTTISISIIFIAVWMLISWILFTLIHYPIWGIWTDGGVGITFGQPNFLAGYVAICFPFLLYWLSDQKKKISFISYILFSGLILCALLTTKSWGGVLAFVTSIVFWILATKSRSNKTILLQTGAVFIFLCLGAIVIFKYLSLTPADIAPEGRVRIINSLLISIQKRPWLGYGVSNVDYAFKDAQYPYPLLHDVYVDKAHSHFLEVLTTTGIIGLITYVIFLLIQIKNIHTNIPDNHSYFKVTLWTILLIYIVHTQTNVIGIGEEIIFWFIVGITNAEIVTE